MSGSASPALLSAPAGGPAVWELGARSWAEACQAPRWERNAFSSKPTAWGWPESSRDGAKMDTNPHVSPYLAPRRCVRK